MPSILLVDDEISLLEVTSLFLEKKYGYQIISVSSGKKAIEMIRSDIPIDGIVSDYDMPEMNGIELLEYVRMNEADLPFILFTGRGREEVAIQALNKGADYYLQKGGDPKSQFTELANMIERAVSAKQNLRMLRHNELMFRDFFDHSADAILILKDGIIIRCNHEFTRLTGYSSDEIIGKKPDFFSTEYHPEGSLDHHLADSYLSMNTDRGPYTFLWKESIKDGSVRDFEVRLLSFSFGKEILIHGIIRDVTSELEKEHMLHLTQLRLETLLTLHTMRDLSAKEITDYALEKVVQITDSQYGYLAFVHKGETELEMYSWSVTAMKDCAVNNKPIIYMVVKTGLWGEPIRQRKPIITNDYSKEEIYARGVPDGHVPICRHMGVPVFHGEKIVMIAGVANKSLPYTKDDADQMTLLLNGLWDLLTKKRVEDELHRKNEELATAYEELLATDEELRRVIAEKNLR